MSAGSRVVPIRFPKPLLEDIQQALVSLDMNGRGELLTFSQWVRRACERDLKHRERSNSKPRKSKAQGTSPTIP